MSAPDHIGSTPVEATLRVTVRHGRRWWHRFLPGHRRVVRADIPVFLYRDGASIQVDQAEFIDRVERAWHVLLCTDSTVYGEQQP